MTQTTTDLQAAFDAFDAACRESREMVEQSEFFRQKPHLRAAGYNSVACGRALAYALVVAPRTDHPEFHTQTVFHSYVGNLGMPCYNMDYGVIVLDGARRYRLTGHIGALKLLVMQVHNQPLGHAESTVLGNYELSTLADAKGRFELILAPEPQDGNWVRLDPESRLNWCFVRRVFADATDDHGRLEITNLDDPGPSVEYDPDQFAERLHRAADMLRHLTTEWTLGFYHLYKRVAGGQPNQIGLVAGEQVQDVEAGSASTTYGLGVWELQPGEVALIKWKPCDAAYWDVQLGDVWSNGLDFCHHQTDLNMSHAHLDDDGIFRAVISPTDPGVPNWLDTRGYHEGTLVMRHYLSVAATEQPTVEVLPLEDLSGQLPPNHPTVPSEQRQAALEQRSATFRAALFP